MLTKKLTLNIVLVFNLFFAVACNQGNIPIIATYLYCWRVTSFNIANPSFNLFVFNKLTGSKFA